MYFVRLANLVKIGTSAGVRLRLQQIRYGSGAVEGMATTGAELLATMPGGRPVERAVHEMFATLRYRREWFFFDEPLTSFVQAVAAVEEANRARHARAFAVKDLPPRPLDVLVSLAEAVAAGIVPWSKPATKMRLSRARAAGRPVPAPLGRRGRQVDLYAPADLAAWVESEMAA